MAADREIDFAKDDILLWQASVGHKFYHNRVVVLPEESSRHLDVVGRFADSNANPRRKDLANTIIAKDVVLNHVLALRNKQQKIRTDVPAAWNKSRVNIVLKSLVGREPSAKELVESDPRGGLIEIIDTIRNAEIAGNIGQIYLNLINASAAEQIESHYREAIGNRLLSDDFKLFFEKTGDEVGIRTSEPTGPKYSIGATMVRVSYAGAQALKNVVVVSRATMKPLTAKSQAARGMVRGFNELFDPGSDRNQAADDYVLTSQILSATPQVALAFVPVLEPGDVLYVSLYSDGSFWNIQEAKISLYSNHGTLLDNVMMVAGPENDLDLIAQGRQPKKKPVPASPSGKDFKLTPITSRIELNLRSAADSVEGFSFEACVPVGQSFRAIGLKMTVDGSKPLFAVARNADGYVAVGPSKTTGNGLILVPKSAVAKATEIDERTDEQKARAKEIEDQVKRNNSNAKKMPTRPPSAPTPKPTSKNRK